MEEILGEETTVPVDQEVQALLDELKRVSVIYLQTVSAQERAKALLTTKLLNLAMDGRVENGRRVAFFTQYLQLKSDGDIYFEYEVESNEPHINIGYTAGPEYNVLDQQIQEEILQFCASMEVDIDVDFNLEPELQDGRATYFFLGHPQEE